LVDSDERCLCFTGNCRAQLPAAATLDTTLFLSPNTCEAGRSAASGSTNARRRTRDKGRYMAVKTIHAPIPGIFYRRPAPDQPPFKNDGDSVAIGDTVGLIEVMKTFTPVAAEEAGRNAKFLVENEEAIMAGQALVELES
jgi:biotin carboxyl carrier protein